MAHSHSRLPPETDGLMYQFNGKELYIEKWHKSWKGIGILESPITFTSILMVLLPQFLLTHPLLNRYLGFG